MTESTVTAPSRKSVTYLDKAPMSRSILSSGGSPRQKKSISENVDDHNVPDQILDGRKERENRHYLKSDGGMLTPMPSGSLNVGALSKAIKDALLCI